MTRGPRRAFPLRWPQTMSTKGTWIPRVVNLRVISSETAMETCTFLEGHFCAQSGNNLHEALPRRGAIEEAVDSCVSSGGGEKTGGVCFAFAGNAVRFSALYMQHAAQ